MFRKVLVFAKKNPQLTESFFSLSILNGLNFLLPLVSLPYILRVIGPEKFGLYSFILVIVQYVILFSNYGFSFSATKFIAENRNEKEVLTSNFSAILLVRFLLALLGSIILFPLFFFIPNLIHEKISYFFSLGIIFGDVFIPIWFFQGMEKMRFITIANIVSKGLFTILIFIFIRTSEDYQLILLLNSLGYVFAAFLSLLIVKFSFRIPIVIPKYRDMQFHLIDGWHIFLSTISMNLYRNANIFILGLLTNNYVVGIYSSAEKIIKALQALVSPVSEALFPFLSRKFSFQSKKESFNNIFKISKVYFIGLSFLSIFVFFLAEPLVRYVFGIKYMDSLISIRILSFVILFGGMNYLLGIIGLINLGQKKSFTKFVIIAGFANILTTTLTVPYFTYVGASIGMILSEIILFSLCVKKLTFMNKYAE